MKPEELKRLFEMLYSNDKEMNDLALASLQGISYAQFKALRGTSFKGNPFFPYKLKHQARALGRAIRKRTNNPKILKEQLLGAKEKDDRVPEYPVEGTFGL